MKNIITLILCTFCSVGIYAQSFEGVIEMKKLSQGLNEKETVIWSVKGGEHYMDVKSPSRDYGILSMKNDPLLYILTNEDKKVAYAIKGASDVETNDLFPFNSMAQKVDAEQTVVGYTCTRYNIINAKYITTCWVANDFPLNQNTLPTFIKSNGVFPILSSNNIVGMPMIIETKDSQGTIVFRQEITNVQEQSVTSSYFNLSGYEVVKVKK